MPKALSAIVAMSMNRVIGKDNALPWHLPDDLKHFKKLTLNKTIIMGRKTYESIGKPLPNRKNIILTRQLNYQAPDCMVVNNIDAVLNNDEECFLIGGAEIFQKYLPKISTLYLTIIHATVEGDTFFPPLDENEWLEVERIFHEADKEHIYSFSFVTLKNLK